MAKVIMTLECGVRPTLEQLKERYQLTADEIDESFGVVAIDPNAGHYSVLVEESAVKKMSDTDDWKVSGPYANPETGPLGPPEGGA